MMRGIWQAHYPRGESWVTSEEVVVDVGGRTFRVPAGFETDFFSIPRVLWPFIGHPRQRGGAAAVVHDYLYRTGSVSRDVADEVFRILLRRLGVGYWRRQLLFWGVRAFGGSAYRG